MKLLADNFKQQY